MQQLAHLKIDGKIIKVLARLVLQNKHGAKYDGGYVSLKLRTSGELGTELIDEGDYLAHDQPQLLAELLAGKVVKC